MGFIEWLRTKLNAPTQSNNELYFALNSLLRMGQVEFYNKDPRTYIDKGYVTNPNVYSIINKITRPASSVPFALYEIKEEKAFRKYKALMESGQRDEARVQHSKALVLSENKDRQKIFIQPNESQSWTEFCEGAIGFKLLTGNNFIYGLSPAGFEDRLFFTKIYNMPSQFVEIIIGTWDNPVKAYRLLMNINVEFEANHVLHRKYWNPQFDESTGIFSGTAFATFGQNREGGTNFYGLSPLAPLCNVVKRSNDGYVASMKMLVNGIPAGILSPENGGRPLNPNEKKKLDEAWKERFGGASNKNQVMKATVPLKWQALGMNSVDMQLEGIQQNDLATIARVYNVPKEIAGGGDRSIFDSGEKFKLANKSLWTDAIIPELNDLQEGLNRFLVPGWEAMDGKKYYIDYDLSGVGALQGNMKEMSDRIMREMEKGLWSPNEARILLGNDADLNNAAMDQRFIGTNMRPLVDGSNTGTGTQK